MWIDVLLVTCLSLLLVELGLLAYFAVRRRWIVLGWLAVGLIGGAFVGGALASTVMLPWVENNLTAVRANSGFAGGLLVAFTFASVMLVSLVGAVLGGTLVGALGCWMGHRLERRACLRRIQRITMDADPEPTS